jgi:chemotaxis protein MotB
LSRQGVKKLREAARVYSNARLSLLMVEGYTDHKGPTAVNQVESYQRAMTVRQFLIDDMGFDPDRVLAIGYGESEQVDGKMAPGFEVANRRIVLKAVPVN